MNKSLGALLLVAVAVPLQAADSGSCECKVTSHSFFTARPHYQSASAERVSLAHDPMKRENGKDCNVQFTLFGSRSRKDDKALARYFSPFCKDTLVVKESVDKDTDLTAQHFNVVSANAVAVTGQTFESALKLNVRQSVFGLGFTYRHNLSQLFGYEDCEHPWWFEVSTPLVRVQNTVSLDERPINNGGNVATIAGLPEGQILFGNMKDAFNQKAWKYGKIDSKDSKHHKTRLADIELKVGYEWMNTECCGLESWMGVLIPTGNRPDAEFVFEPVVGHNKHWGLMMGNSAHFKLYDNDCWDVYAYVDCSSKYLFSKTERRSFDLKNKPWSRYMEVYTSFEQAQQAATLANTNATAAIFLASPGINLFTQDLNVKPRFSHTMNIALAASSSCWDVEAGYNLFVREAECVELDGKFNEVAALKASTGAGRVNKERRINNDLNALNLAFTAANYQDAIIKKSDLDLDSAAHPCVIAHTIYGALGYKFEDTCYPMAIGAGASYDFGRGNEVMDRWTLWGKLGVSF